jgi:hypothetical protein
MTILFDATTKVKPAPSRTFGRGVLASLPTYRIDATLDDLAWAAQHLNESSPDYDVLAEESAQMDSYERGFVPC